MGFDTFSPRQWCGGFKQYSEKSNAGPVPDGPEHVCPVLETDLSTSPTRSPAPPRLAAHMLRDMEQELAKKKLVGSCSCVLRSRTSPPIGFL